MTPKKTLTEAYNELGLGLKKYAYFKLNSKALADNLVQEAFVKTWSYLKKGGKILQMKAFLYNVLNNLIVDEYRKQKSLSLNELADKGFEPSKEEAPRIISQIDSRLVCSVIDELPEKYRVAIKMRYLQERSIEEISATTHQSKNATAVQIFRGLEKLRTLCGAQ